MIESRVEGTNILTEEQKRTEALKRAKMHDDPQKHAEIMALSEELAKKFGFH